ncbi:MAG: (2Fe-2S)-binding protein [Chloroflexota bacterium]|nr:MAG: (2Fe-2S)-binding protein [Chloroflexota bacterium]
MSNKTTKHTKNNIICRCEEITEQEIRDAIREFDLKTVDDVKRLTRAGMGLCQGRTCARLTARILSEETNIKPSELLPPSKRPPTRPIEIQSLAEAEGNES